MPGNPALSRLRNGRIGTALKMLVAGWGVAMMAGAASAQTTSLDRYLESVRIEYDLPALAAAVIKGGVVVASAATGTRVYGENLPVTIDDRFHIGSNTKSMTATLAGMLVDTDSDLAVVVTTNFPGGRANAAAGEVLKNLYLTMEN
ncbi:serine hydrolase domain-containing protein [Roseibium sp. AS2]|uniref:serine hydrolase domain-containing protein n=1 Tax=Roseibium sp. AS2 TaxID=3135781 RepID=UPI0031814877